MLVVSLDIFINSPGFICLFCTTMSVCTFMIMARLSLLGRRLSLVMNTINSLNDGNWFHVSLTPATCRFHLFTTHSRNFSNSLRFSLFSSRMLRHFILSIAVWHCIIKLQIFANLHLSSLFSHFSSLFLKALLFTNGSPYLCSSNFGLFKCIFRWQQEIVFHNFPYWPRKIFLEVMYLF